MDYKLTLYVDADYAGDEDRLSTGGFCVLFGGSLLSFSSKKISLIVTSSTEAELYAAHHAIEECLFLRAMLASIGVRFIGPALILEDNSAVISAVSSSSSSRLKQHDVVLHFIRQQVSLGHFKFQYVKSSSNVGDIFTKPLPRQPFMLLRTQLGISDGRAGPQGGARSDDGLAVD